MRTTRANRSRAYAAATWMGVLAIVGTFGCTPREAEVTEVPVRGTDYAFDAPDSLPPGPAAFTFENAGQVPHEMILVRLKEGTTLPQVMEAARGGQDPGDFIEGGTAILIARPGNTTATRLVVDLLPNRTYALVCNFTDAEDAPPHIALGMAKSIQVGAGGA